MKTKFPILCAIGGLSIMGAIQAKQDDWSLNNHWTVYGDYLYLKRTTLDNKKIVMGGKHLGTKRTLDRFDFEPGYRVGLFFHASSSNSFEGSYSHIIEWEGDHHLDGDSNLYVPFTILSLSSDYYNAGRAREEYTSRFDSGELNWWHHFTPRRVNYFALSSILGLRYIQLDENFHLTMTRGSNQSTYKIDASNHLYGGHIGGDFQWNPTDCFSVDLMAKAGAFYNDLDQHTHARDNNNTTILGKYSRSGSNTTFLGEAQVFLSYQLGCYFNVHIGYQFLYLAGLSLAPKQFSLRNTPALRHRLSKNGEAIIHGAFAGINIGF